MPTTGFHSDWVTIDDHRILLECRASFPDQKMRFIASVAATTCDNNSDGRRARVVQIFYDDKACIYSINIASTREDDRKIEDDLGTALSAIFNNGNCQVSVEIVKQGDEGSDHYNHMEHLSLGADVAVDRWRHSDPTYTAKVTVPK